MKKNQFLPKQNDPAVFFAVEKFIKDMNEQQCKLTLSMQYPNPDNNKKLTTNYTLIPPYFITYDKYMFPVSLLVCTENDIFDFLIDEKIIFTITNGFVISFSDIKFIIMKPLFSL